MEWTTPEDVRADVQRAWDRGRILGARVTGTPMFPLTIRTRRPDSRALSDRFDDVRQWIRALDEGSRAHCGAGYEIVWAQIEHRQLGRNRVPDGVVIPSEADALHLIGKRRLSERFDALCALTLASFPTLREWIAKRPLELIEHEAAWARVIAVLTWLCEHPRPAVYLRQLDIAGVDTKFIQQRRKLFTELLDQVLPPDAFDPAASSFEQRYGFRAKAPTIRFRILDRRRALGGLTDNSAPGSELHEHPPHAERVFITENEVNGLAFPDLDDSIVIFGLGYGVDTLGALSWLHTRAIEYWGDIDTHGLAILDRLRAHFPHVRSLLMDRETLLAHREMWVEEAAPHPGPCTRLSDAERALFDDLRADRLGRRVRLEQERIGYTTLGRALSAHR